MNSPFKFLDAYKKEDAHIFFGRKLDINQIFEKIHREKLLLVYGASGTGKTSLIQCGLANQFEDTDWFPLIIRRKNNLISSLLDEIKAKSLTSIEVSSQHNFELIKEALESLYLDYFKPIFLILDQFEELFISGEKNEIIFFFEILNKLLESDLQLKVILIIREEYLAYLTNMEYVVPKLFKNRHRVEAMPPSSIKEVILSSCKEFDITLESDQITNQIYDKLINDKGSVELTHLQVFLDRLYKSVNIKDSNEIAFTSELIEKLGHLEDVLGTFLAEQMGLLKDPSLGWKILKFFITNKGTKKSIDRKTLFEEFDKYGMSIQQVSNILNSLISSRVLKLINGTNYELSHDSLALKVFDQLSVKEKNLMQVKRFLEQEYSNYKSRNVLLSKENLNYIIPFLKELKLPKNHQLLIKESKKELNKKRNRWRWTVITIIVALLTLSIFSAIQWFRADEAKKIALEQQEKAEKALQETEKKQEELEKAEADRLKAEGDRVISIVDRIINSSKKITDEETKANKIQQAKDTLIKYIHIPSVANKYKTLKNEK